LVKKNRLRKEKKNDNKRFPSLIQRRLFFLENYFMAYWNIFEIVTESWRKGTIFAFYFRQSDDNDKVGRWSISQTNE
jgi:hypothetical protein